MSVKRGLASVRGAARSAGRWSALTQRTASRSVLPSGDATSDARPRRWVASALGDGDEVERSVELAVSAAVEAMAGLVLAGGRWHR